MKADLIYFKTILLNRFQAKPKLASLILIDWIIHFEGKILNMGASEMLMEQNYYIH